MLERGRGHARRRVLAAGPHHRAAEAGAAADAALDRRQQRGGHAPGGTARRRLDPVVHHSGAVPRRRREDAGVRRGGRPRVADRPLRHALLLLPRGRPGRRPPRWPTPSSHGAASTTRPWRAHRLSARPRSCASGWRSTSPPAAPSSSCGRCARPTGCSIRSPGSPPWSCPRSTAGRADRPGRPGAAPGARREYDFLEGPHPSPRPATREAPWWPDTDISSSAAA